MSCPVFIGSKSNPLLSDKIIQDIQSDFSTNCSLWLDRIYPLAEIGVRKDVENADVKFPKIYLNDGNNDYLNAIPDDSNKGYMFFELGSDGEIDRTEDEHTVELSIVFWVNQKKIDDRTEDYIMELVADALKCLHTGTYKNDITNINYAVNTDTIFNKYDLSESEVQMLMYPYSAFKLTFNLTVNQDIDCFDAFNVMNGARSC